MDLLRATGSRSRAMAPPSRAMGGPSTAMNNRRRAGAHLPPRLGRTRLCPGTLLAPYHRQHSLPLVPLNTFAALWCVLAIWYSVLSAPAVLRQLHLEGGLPHGVLTSPGPSSRVYCTQACSRVAVGP